MNCTWEKQFFLTTAKICFFFKGQMPTNTDWSWIFNKSYNNDNVTIVKYVSATLQCYQVSTEWISILLLLYWVVSSLRSRQRSWHPVQERWTSSWGSSPSPSRGAEKTPPSSMQSRNEITIYKWYKWCILTKNWILVFVLSSAVVWQIYFCIVGEVQILSV